MTRSPLYESTYTPRFSGHETFPLRYGWLKKAYDAVRQEATGKDDHLVFTRPEAIARFGVGKNMVASIRYWADAAGIIDDDKGTHKIKPTNLGARVFGDGDDSDPYLERPATLWLLHWLLASNPANTTLFWAFSHFNEITFQRDQMVKGLKRLAEELGGKRASENTIKSDISCFVHTYSSPQGNPSGNYDDALESPLTELGLLKSINRGTLRFSRGPKPQLTAGVFLYALLDFWSEHHREASTLSFEAIAHTPGSPGRIFQLDENDIADRLMRVGEGRGSKLEWSETAGLKQLIRVPELHFEKELGYALDLALSPDLGHSQ